MRKIFTVHLFNFLILLVFTSCNSRERADINFDTFDELTTLTLEAYFHDNTDCGEWGGHKETIQIVKQENRLFLSYKRDSSRCIRRSLAEKEPEANIKREYFGPLTNKKQKLINNYINELYSYDPSKYSISNAIDYYGMELKRHLTTEVFRIDYAGNDWRKFEEMRNKIILD